MAGLVFTVTCVEETVFLKWNALEKVSVSNFLGSIWTQRMKRGSTWFSAQQHFAALT